jgi:hypothetical protein
MTVDRGPNVSLREGAKRLLAEHAEQMVVVRDHQVFGMHVSPFGPSGPGSQTRGSTGAMRTRSDQALPPR